MRSLLTGTICAALFSTSALAAPPPIAQADPYGGEAAFRSLYKELVETNTTLSSGSCTLAAERMAARLKAALLTPSWAPCWRWRSASSSA